MSYRTYRQPARAPVQGIARFLTYVPLLVLGVIAANLGYQLLMSSFSTASPTIAVAPKKIRLALGEPGRGGPLGEADGAIPDGTTVFDDRVPGVAKLDPDLLGALRQAGSDAGVQLVVDSGWRSAAYQEQLLRDAVSQYGSEEEAARWVATPTTSAHVSGDAVDIGPPGSAAWLSDHGDAYGLCRIYGNEPWHFELRPDAVTGGCPEMYADPTHDPRMEN